MECAKFEGPRPTADGATIAGGFVRVPAGSLLAAWRACQGPGLGIGSFRAWLGLREMVARRAAAGASGTPAYTHDELARLAAVSTRRARVLVDRLVAAGLVGWSATAITFAGPPDLGGDGEVLGETIGRGRGPLAVPRRLLRHLAAGARSSLIATALGVLLRCLSRRRGGFDGRGRVKASWIARAFGVDLRRVKQARRELVDLGWIAPGPSEPWAERRWGRAYRIDLAWAPPNRRLPPVAPAPGPDLPPPDSHPDLPPGGGIHQEPAGRGPAGSGAGGDQGAEKPGPTPRLDDVRPEDLREVGRALALFDQAVARRLVGPSEADRLRFLAVAEHAAAVGTANPPGLFARLIRSGLWHHATQADEDAAAARLREHLHGRPRPGRGPTARPRPSPEGRPASAPASLASIMARLGLGGAAP